MTPAWFISVAMLLLGGAFGNYLRYVERQPNRLPDFSRIPMEQDGYFGTEGRFDEKSYEILKADTSTLRFYRTPNGIEVRLFVAYFSSQKYGEQIHSPKHCLPGGGWNIQDLRPYRLVVGDRERRINHVVIANGRRRQLMFYWFETRSGSIRSEFTLKWDLMMNALRLRPTDAAFVRLTLDFSPPLTETTAEEELLTFLGSYLPPIDAALPFSTHAPGLSADE
jgi:EpsI family protein